MTMHVGQNPESSARLQTTFTGAEVASNIEENLILQGKVQDNGSELPGYRQPQITFHQAGSRQPKDDLQVGHNLNTIQALKFPATLRSTLHSRFTTTSKQYAVTAPTHTEEVFTVKLMLGWTEEFSFGCVAALQDGSFNNFFAGQVFQFFHIFHPLALLAGAPDCENCLHRAFTIMCGAILGLQMQELQQDPSISAAAIQLAMQQPSMDTVSCPLTSLYHCYIPKPSTSYSSASSDIKSLTRAQAQSSGLFTEEELARFPVK
ncbi:hypothetical protein C8J56DRAFT_892891 [Mycena floridula]|nr:hypothetical protein C8J56DRAFT_892891 [Mycena floridula]